MAKSKTAPVGVKIISVLYYIGAALLLLGGLITIFGGAAFASLLGGLGALGGALFVVLGIVFVAFAVLYFFVARGLWKLTNWARITAIVLSGLSVLSGLMNLFGGAIGNGISTIVIAGVIGGYLWFSSDVKKAFA